ncbi:hypothetical protein GJ744_008301 [Endocarpon pusillum]|uniref:NB-ARC domain-containing protein n=1 Tax=Endocarpon pusillum TaxID=364733 RepID=A0A8H7ALL7_9EURO|nr:hypothetical protein GJ744_008301 [Endocarpon pusillum]
MKDVSARTCVLYILVDKAFCTTHAPLEEFLALPLDHMGICNFEKSTNGLQTVIEFITMVLKDADQCIAKRLEAMNTMYTIPCAYSPIASDQSIISFERIAEEHNEARMRSQLQEGNTSLITEQGSSVPSQGFEFVPTVTSFSTPQREPRLPCYVLDSIVCNPDFFGRVDILQTLENSLLPTRTKFISSESTRTKYFALSGMGGLGKTEIATQFAFRHKEKFDAVFWVRADEIAKLDQSYSHIAQKLGLETTAESTSQVVSKGLVKEWLSNPWTSSRIMGNIEVSSQTQATWLIIFDNADEPSIVADYWPVMGNGSVLITSRDPIAKTYYSKEISGIDLEPFSDAEGASLLKALTLDDDVSGVAEHISRRLGGLPLALTQMASVIRRQELSFSEFMKSYENEREHSELHGLRYSTGGGNYSYTISSVWRLDEFDPRPRSLLRTLAFLDPDCIEEIIFEEWSTHLPAQEFFGKLEKSQLSIHRMVQDVVIAQMSTEDISQFFWNAVCNLATQWPSGRAAPSKKKLQSTPPKAHSIQEWPKCQTLYPHVLRLKQTWQKFFQDKPAAYDIQWAGLLADAAWWQFERGRTSSFDGFYDVALNICENSDDPDRESLLVDICLGIAAIAAEANDHKSSRAFKLKALDYQLQYLQGTDIQDARLSRCFSELAIALIQDKDYANAENNLLQGMEINNRIGSFSALAYANLGLLYTFQEKYEAAEEVLGWALSKQEEMFGKMDKVSFRTGRVLYAFGNLRAAQGRLPESHEYHQMALEQFRSTIGDHHHRTADVCHKVAEHLIRIEHYKDAMSMIDQALLIWGLDPKVYQPEIARTNFLKGQLLTTLGKHEKAEKLIEKATTFWSATVGFSS